MLCSISHLADLTGLDRRTVSKRVDHLRASPGPKAAKLYDSREALPLLYGAVGGDLDPAQERAALDAARRREVEYRTQQRAGELMPAEVVGQLVGSILADLRAALMAQHNTIAAECPEIPNHAIRRIQQSNRDMLLRLSEAPLPPRLVAALDALEGADNA